MPTYQFRFHPGDTLYEITSFSNNVKVIEPIIIHQIVIDSTGISYIDNYQQKLFKGEDFGKVLFASQYEAFKTLNKDIKLPCKIGTTLYTYDFGGLGSYINILPYTVKKFMQKDGRFYFLTEHGNKKSFDELNVSLFFSKEKAEEAAEEKLSNIHSMIR